MAWWIKGCLLSRPQSIAVVLTAAGQCNRWANEVTWEQLVNQFSLRPAGSTESGPLRTDVLFIRADDLCDLWPFNRFYLHSVFWCSWICWSQSSSSCPQNFCFYRTTLQTRFMITTRLFSVNRTRTCWLCEYVTYTDTERFSKMFFLFCQDL